MNSIELKQEIHGYVEQANDEILEAIKTLLKTSFNSSRLSSEQIIELEKRKNNHTENKSKSYTWEETLNLIKSKKG